MSKSVKNLTGPALEALVAVLTPVLFVISCMAVRVNPRDRLGQIAGIAGIELRFFVGGTILLIALLIAARVRDGRGFAMTSRLVCAAAAGMASALIAGGILVALRGTPWGLHTPGGDVLRFVDWANAANRGESFPALYPPVPIHVLALYSKLSGLPPEFAVKHLQIAGTAAFGPVAYLCWRFLLSPGWALGVALVSIGPFVDAYKPYPNLVLMAFVPLSLLFLKSLRDVPEGTWLQLVRRAALLGAAFGAMAVSYSGWFKWSAPGLFVATLVVFPWRTARREGIAFLGIAAVTFLLFAGRYILGLVTDPSTAIVDNYIYFDVTVEPMYIAMWRNDTPGPLGMWPPLGELGGVGVFTLIAITGFGVAVALGRKSTHVIGLGLMMLGAWLLRFYYAKDLWATRLVQLYPRTTALILYCLLVFVCFAVMWSIERRPADSPLRGRSGLIGAVCALLLFGASMGSSIADRYMPSKTDPLGPGFFAWSAHKAAQENRPRLYRPQVLPWVRRPAP